VKSKVIHWTEEEIKELLTLRNRGYNIDKIADAMGLKASRVRNKLCTLEGMKSGTRW